MKNAGLRKIFAERSRDKEIIEKTYREKVKNKERINRILNSERNLNKKQQEQFINLNSELNICKENIDSTVLLIT